MDAINSWQAVITELGGGHDNAAAKTAVQHALQARTPAAASAVLGGKEVFYTPLSAVQQGTPVDAWHSILTTLTGNTKAAQGMVAGARGSACSSMAGSPRASAAAGHSSPHGSPGMVRQLFTSTPGSFRPERGASSTGSTPRHPLAQAQLHLRQPAGAAAHTADRPAPGSPSSSPRRRNLSTAGPGYAERVSPFQRTLAATRQQDSPPRGMSATQQLSDRLDALRASAESILHSVTSAAGSPAGRYPGSTAGSPRGSATEAAAARCSPRSGGGRSVGALTASSANHAVQDSRPPRKLFPSPSNPEASRSAAAGGLSSPLQRLLQSAQMSREAATAAGSLELSQAAAAAPGAAAGSWPSYAGPQQSSQQLQSQQPLQQQLTGAVSKVDQLLAAMAERQRSSAGGSSSTTEPSHTARASVPSHQPQHTPQLQQQEMLQQLLLQQQQLINQLLPLIPKPDQPQSRGSISSSGGAVATVPAGSSAAVDTSTTGTAGNPVSKGSHGFQQHQLASLLQAAARVEELQSRRGSTSPRQEGSALVIPLLSEPQPSPRMRLAAQQLQQARSGGSGVGSEAGGDIASGPGAGEQQAAEVTSKQGTAARSSQAVQVQADQGDTSGHVAREAGSSSSTSSRSSSSKSSGRSSIANHEIEQATGLVSRGSSSAGGAAGRNRSGRRRWNLPLPSGSPSASDAATAAVHASGPQQQRQSIGAHSSAHSSMHSDSLTVDAENGLVSGHAEPAAAGADSSSRHWSAAGSKSMPAVGTKPDPCLPDQQPGRFLSQGPSRSAHANGNLAQQLGLPQVVRFRGGASMGDGAEGAVGAQHGESRGGGSSSSRAVSSDGSSRGPDAAPGGAAPTSCGRAAAEAAGSEPSGRGQSEPGTPTAALPRVHTPGKPAAAVAAELSTPQLAHSAAAVMTVSEAWREETSGTQARWQQLLAEWSASEVDTWEPQRLTEPSTLTAQHSRMSSAPGLNLSHLAPQGEEHQRHGHAQQQQQQQDVAAGAGAGSVQHVSEGGLRHRQPPEGGHAGAQQQQEQQTQQQEQEQVTFVRLAREHDLSPRKIPSAAALHPAAESAAATGGAAVETDASEVSLFCTAPQQQQQQQQEAQQAANPQLPLPAWPDTTRKQLFTSAAADDSSSSRSSSRDLGATVTSDTIAAAAAAEATCTAAQQQSLSSGAVAADVPGRAAASDAGAVAVELQQVQTNEQQQQQQLEQQEEEGLERLNQLLHDLQGLQHRLQGMQLQTPRQTLHAKVSGPAGAASQSASSSNPSARCRSPFSSAAAVVGVAAASSTLVQQHSSSAVNQSAGSGSVSAEGIAATPTPAAPAQASAADAGAASAGGNAVTPPQAMPVSAADARGASAVGRISSLKQRLQDSRAALQAISVPSGGGSADLQQQVFSASATAAAAATGAFSQGSLPVFMRSGGESASVASSSHSGSAAGPVTTDTLAGSASSAAAAAAAAPAASAWLTGGPLQQYLERRSSTGRVSSTGLGAGSSGTLGSMGSALPAVGDRPSGGTVLSGGRSAGGSRTSSSHVQALVSKWRAAAAAQQEAQAGTLLLQQQQQQQYEGRDDAGLSTLQAMLARVRTGGPAATGSVSEVVGGAAAHTSPLPQWLSAGLPGSHLQQLITSRSGGGAGTAGGYKMPPAAPGVVTPLRQRTPLQGGLGENTAGGRGSTGARNTGSSIQTGPGAGASAAGGAWSIHNPLFQQTPVSMPPADSSRRADCYSSGSRGSTRSGAFTGMVSGGAGSSARPAVRCSSTPPSAGNLARWTQQGSPTGQLRQQLQAAAQQFQLQEQGRQQQHHAAVQVTPVSANLAKSFATLDRTLAGLKSVSPPAHAAAAMGRNASAAPPAPMFVLKTPSGLSLSSSRSVYSGGSCSSAGGSAVGRTAASAGRCSGRSAAEILAGTAAAAEATRSSLAIGKAQAASARSESPVQMLRRQQEMLASIGMLSKPPSQERAFGFGPWQ